MKIPHLHKYLAIAAFPLILAACGGGGGGSSSTPAPAPVVNVSASGVWSGITGPTGYTMNLIVMPNNTVYTNFGTPVSGGLSVLGVNFGSVTSSGSSFSGPFREYLYNNTSYSGTLSGTVVANSSISGTATYTNGGAGTFALVPLTSGSYNFNTPAVLSTITGAWVGTLLTGTATTVTIASNGTLSGSGGGCTFVGTIAPDPSGVNVFATSITYGSTCPTVGLVQTGISLSYITTSGTRQLLSMVSSATTGGAFFAQR
jgi:hypothetical protein